VILISSEPSTNGATQRIQTSTSPTLSRSGATKIWKNTLFLPASSATVSVYDAAMMMGDSVFEMCRSFNKRPFKLREHMERLTRSAISMQIPLAYDVEALMLGHDDLMMGIAELAAQRSLCYRSQVGTAACAAD